MELVDEVAAVGEDQDAARARRVDETHRGDGLAGARRVLEPEALVGVGIVGLLVELVFVEGNLRSVVVGLLLGLVLVVVVAHVDLDLEVQRLDDLRLVVVIVVGSAGGCHEGAVVLVVVVDCQDRRGGRRRAVAVLALCVGEQRGQGARQGIDLMRVQRRAVGELGLVVGEHALQAQHERVAPPPLRRRHLRPVLDLQQRGVECTTARGAGGERVGGRLTGVHECLAGELLRAGDIGRIGNGRGHDGHWRGISQDRLPDRT